MTRIEKADSLILAALTLLVIGMALALFFGCQAKAQNEPVFAVRSSLPFYAVPVAVATATPAYTSWYFDSQFCGLTHPLAWDEQPIEAMNCTVNYIIGAATPSGKRFPPAPLFLRGKQIGSLCGFMDRKRKVDNIQCSPVYHQ